MSAHPSTASTLPTPPTDLESKPTAQLSAQDFPRPSSVDLSAPRSDGGQNTGLAARRPLHGLGPFQLPGLAQTNAQFIPQPHTHPHLFGTNQPRMSPGIPGQLTPGAELQQQHQQQHQQQQQHHHHQQPQPQAQQPLLTPGGSQFMNGHNGGGQAQYWPTSAPSLPLLSPGIQQPIRDSQSPYYHNQMYSPAQQMPQQGMYPPQQHQGHYPPASRTVESPKTMGFPDQQYGQSMPPPQQQMDNSYALPSLSAGGYGGFSSGYTPSPSGYAPFPGMTPGGPGSNTTPGSGSAASAGYFPSPPAAQHDAYAPLRPQPTPTQSGQGAYSYPPPAHAHSYHDPNGWGRHSYLSPHGVPAPMPMNKMGLGTPYARSATPTDRPFKCDECPQSFNRNHDLKRHKRIHLAVKPFPCPSCDKSFSRKDALKRHILVKGCRVKN